MSREKKFVPSYRGLWESGRLAEVADRLSGYYDHCTLCARRCGVNRRKGETGICQAGTTARISSAHPHFGEERPLVGRSGSGTIFFSRCSLLCLYCQNWDISHSAEGYDITDERLAEMMMKLQELGCHNINLVTPTHFLPNIVRAIVFAAESGLNIPIVYNTGGYESVEVLTLLEGVVDIYLPDYKYSDERVSAKYSAGAGDYPRVAGATLKEMHRQVGILKTDRYGVAVRGLLIRHLVLPRDLAGSEAFFKFVVDELDPRTHVNIMAQYHPAYQAYQYPELSHRITMDEYQTALNLAGRLGIENLE